MPGLIDKGALLNSWVHSHEEDTDEEMVFRPASFAFPPSRGRKAFELAPNGELRQSRPGPTDIPSPSVGSWILSGDDQPKLDLTAEGSTTTLRLTEVLPDKLVARKR